MQRRSFFKLGIGSMFASTLLPTPGWGVLAQLPCEFSGTSVYQGDPVGKVITVGGFVDPSALGKTLPHEHLLIHHTSNPGEEYKLDTINEAVCQLNQYAQAGGGTLVELTSRGMRWDLTGEVPPFCDFPLALRTIWDKSRVAASEIKIVMGSSYYKSAQHPSDMSSRSIEQIEAEIIQDIQVGVGNSGIRAGIIGEVGVGSNFPLNEEKVLIASCLAQIKTGVAMNIHFDIDGAPGDTYTEAGMNLRRKVLDICEQVGVDLNRVVMSHFRATKKDAINDAFHEEMIRRGAYIEFDLFGHIQFPTDNAFTVEKSVIKHLVDKGYGDRVLLSQDVYQKALYKGETSCAPGQPGYGYAHLLRDFIPKLTTGTDGITQTNADMLTTENPKRLLPVQFDRPILLSEWPGGAGCAGKVENNVVRLGTPEGQTQMNAPNRNGVAKAFQFNSTTADAIRVPHNSIFNATHPFSVALWFKAGTQPTGTHTCLLDKSHGAWIPTSPVWYERRDTGWTLQLRPDGILQFAVATGSNYSIVTTTASVLNTPTEWQHVTAVYTGSEIQIFLNGKLESRLTLNHVPLGNGGDLYIGRAWAGGNAQRHYTGLMDEVKFFDSGLSENAVLSLYRR